MLAQEFVLQRWAEQDAIGLPMFAIGNKEYATTETLEVALANLDSGTFEVSPDFVRTGHPRQSFAAHGPEGEFLGVEVVPPGGTTPIADSWIDWIGYAEGKWSIEEAPPRWAARELLGVTYFDGEVRVLVRSLQALELWSMKDQQWTSEVLAGPDALGSHPAMASNATTLLIAALDHSGSPSVWERVAGSTTFQQNILQPAPGILQNVPFSLAAPHSGKAAVAWTNLHAASSPGSRLLDAFVAIRESSGWKILDAKFDDTQDLRVGVWNDNAMVLRTTAKQPEIGLWWLNKGSWTQCLLDLQSRPILVEGADGLAIAYTAPSGGGVAHLTTETESCLPSGDKLPTPTSSPAVIHAY